MSSAWISESFATDILVNVFLKTAVNNLHIFSKTGVSFFVQGINKREPLGNAL